MRILFIRHGDPDYKNDTLTEKGWREATLLAERVSKWQVTDFYCSPLGRARDTASLSLKKMNRTATVYPWLAEFVYDVVDPTTGQTHICWDFMPEYWTNEPVYFQKEHWFESSVMKQNEQIEPAYKNLCTQLDKLLASYGYNRKDNYYTFEKSNDTTIVIFCHLGITLAMMSHLLNISPVQLWQGFYIAPTSVTCVATEERLPGKCAFRTQMLGDTLHLQQGGEPISTSGYFTDCFQQ